MYNFDMQKITQFEPRPALKFWNPTLDFVGMIECLSEIRHIAKTGNMKSDVDVVDVRILQGMETIEEIYEEMGREKTKTCQKEYANEERTLTLAKSVLHTAMPNLAPLTGKKIFIAGKGKKSGKNFKYDDYIVLEESDARKVGLIS
ncbi:protein of unknown function [Candidatus Nitrosotalea okcheonensis]|uniref:Uncharacterized protein n=2 Tax=Candidatus Nitrosotalea okcheonensis TaxID=1903276 RepID=A0A2H1FEU6_9ARCH|nr:protein of unknown function [Candidatus Nitrosotalea okcheonensis]